jgi:fructose-bisphosphate aldolase class I
LAADESTGTIGKRFEPIGVENIEGNRQKWRQLLFTTPGWNENISGVILFEETLYQNSTEGKPFVQIMAESDVLPGIKTDKGLGELPTGENFTMGLDGLHGRTADYYKAGARFSKWRNVYKIDVAAGFPTELAI